MQGTQDLILKVMKIPGRKWQAYSAFLSRKSCGEADLAGYNPWESKVRLDLVTNELLGK